MGDNRGIERQQQCQVVVVSWRGRVRRRRRRQGRLQQFRLNLARRCCSWKSCGRWSRRLARSLLGSLGSPKGGSGKGGSTDEGLDSTMGAGAAAARLRMAPRRGRRGATPATPVSPVAAGTETQRGVQVGSSNNNNSSSSTNSNSLWCPFARLASLPWPSSAFCGLQLTERGGEILRVLLLLP